MRSFIRKQAIIEDIQELEQLIAEQKKPSARVDWLRSFSRFKYQLIM